MLHNGYVRYVLVRSNMKRGLLFAVSAAMAWLPAKSAFADSGLVDLGGPNSKHLTLWEYARLMNDPVSTEVNIGTLPNTQGFDTGSHQNQINSVPVPEPVTMGFAALGLLAGLRVRRNRR